MKVLEVSDLRKKLGKREIIKGVTFSVEEGEIFGFLGPNGAGKTTTIRMLVGLIKPDSGTIAICGHDIQKDPIGALKEVGAVVENPELYKYLTGRENLMQIARIRKVSLKDVEDTIRLVGLENRINDKVKKYSLGMKQRLGLAASLLSNSKLLILDEPTNGLDPSGIIDFREIVQKAARERGMAVFVSSHILAEVQNLCDKVAFINDGVIKAVEEINNNTMTTEKDLVCLLSSSDKAVLLKEIKAQGFVHNVREIEKGLEIILEANTTPKLIKTLVNANLEVEEVFKERKGLEQRYMELVEGGIR
ncbi:ABC transporter ATP-binding protein [Clostridium chauvoei]|uniref:ABC transporter ATP-binding protein n=2 Tax=Clostridium chauvoei TaxID=46867 RepID=A0ABD4RJI8_9CLOT|nr:ABC transporter ATP-binding protein [Clostridium chauvoei]ATD56068.1 bacitracin ABC transporter ATP-binding protein [Clostridium chauvoei]ATD58559.1 bacitracin ABC transporter ATP-binding protein [Clostridium chauvoei]MBX7281379.1 ABC transporter ATP-binding protein [Clostridium chauvoei]MBX7283913.1 ABC transporter ATP-binding protein [Clostridium chauvoei]MBX7286468.1 ABC transporter ATP-binding protein [Clostridium chauvoei]